MFARFARFTPRSIRTKLVLIVLTGVAVAMLLAALFSGWRAADRRMSGLQEELRSVGATLAIAVAPAQHSGAYHDVQKILRAIGRMPRITYARVLGKNGELIAAFGNGVVLERDAGLVDAARAPGLLQLLTLKTYPMETSIIHGGERIGTIELIADVSELRGVLSESLATALVSGLLAALIGLLIALRLEKTLTGPILSLTSAMQDVRQRHDYTASVSRVSNDETGVLVDAFNDMLSEIRSRDAALARHRETLEQTVEERTHDLRVATKEAQDANAAKSDFLATMSHEIRTPMNGMLVMAEMLNASGLPPRLQRYADVIVTSGKSLLSIINDILDFSKIEAGRMDLESIPVDPRKLVDEVTRLFAERAAGKGLDLAGYVAADVPKTIAADPVRLNQVLSNLVNNALKFTQTGGVALRLVCENSSEAHRTGGLYRLRFDVVDTGIGIAADKIDSVFEAFSQADQSTTRKFGGTGIGLAICQRLAAAMEGKLSAASVLGEGSTFSLVAPYECLEPAQLFVDAQTAANSRQSGNAVLLALDPGPTFDCLAAYAREHGFVAISSEANGVAGAPADRIVADRIAAAVTRSAAALENLRKTFPDLPCVALSGFGNNGATADAEVSWPLAADEVASMFAAFRTGNIGGLASDRAQATERVTVTKFPGVRVLAADDSAINREVLTEALSRLDVEVVHVTDGLQAVRAVEQDSYDLVFMDGSMPELDGYEATRQIRSRETEQGLPRLTVIALTAHVVGSQAALWRDSGMDDCLTKPFTIAGLEKCLKTWLPDRHLTAETTRGDAEVISPAEDGEQRQDGATAAPADDGHEAAACPPQPDAPEAFPLLDPEVLDEIRKMATGDLDLAAKVVGLYRQHAPDAMRVLQDSWDVASDAEVASAAHALKSLSRNIGAVRVAEICDVVETEARDGLLDRKSNHLERLAEALAATLESLAGPAGKVESDASAA